MTCNIMPDTGRTIRGFGHEDRADISLDESEVSKTVEEAFSKEFLGRVDEVVVFRALNSTIMRGFIEQKINKLEESTGKQIEVDEAIIAQIMEEGFHPDYGARRLNYTVDAVIGRALAELKINSSWDGITRIRVADSGEGEVCAVDADFDCNAPHKD